MKDVVDFVLAGGMLATGSINSLVTKAADSVCQRNSDNQPLLYDPAHHHRPPFWGPPGSAPPYDAASPHPELEPFDCVTFNHPFVQAAFMFIGEVLCGVLYALMRCCHRGEPMPYFNPLLLAVAGLCDMTATSMMYVGLGMTYVSTFQILRGFVVVVTAVFSHFVLGRKQQPYHWCGVALVVIGTAVVGAAPFAPAPFGTRGKTTSGASNPTLGNIIIVLAQVVVGVQMCWEEKFVTGYNIPALLVVGWEGFFGLFAIHMVITIVGQVHSFSPQVPDVPYHNLNQSLVNASTVNSWGGGNSYSAFFFDQPDAFLQFGMPSPNNPKLMLAMISMIFSIAFFNYFGISVTKKMSAAHRMVLDSVRTCVVWAAGLMLFGEAFSFLQLIGFLILIAGTLVYNVIGPFRVPGLDYTAFDHPTDETDLHTQTFQALNVAIAARDFRRAATLQDELATLGRAGAGGSQGGLKAPLLNTQQQQQ